MISKMIIQNNRQNESQKGMQNTYPNQIENQHLHELRQKKTVDFPDDLKSDPTLGCSPCSLAATRPTPAAPHPASALSPQSPRPPSRLAHSSIHVNDSLWIPPVTRW